MFFVLVLFLLIILAVIIYVRKLLFKAFFPDYDYSEEYEFDLYVVDSIYYSDDFINEYCEYHKRRRLYHPELYKD